MLSGPGQRWILHRPPSALVAGAAEKPSIIRIPRPCNDNIAPRDRHIGAKITGISLTIAGLLALAIWRAYGLF